STAAVNYTISGLPSTGASVEFHEASGAHDIVVWAEPDIWNDATHQEITAPTSQVTVNLGATYHSVVVYDPLVSAQAQKTYTDVSQITVGVTDHPLIIEVNGSGATTGGTTGGATTPPAPAAPTGLSDAAIVGGYVNAAHNTATQALTGISTAGATITVYDGAAKLGTATADSTGHWGYTLGGLADGAHALTATATTAGGVSASSAALTFTVDTVAPGAPSGLADSAIVNGVVDAAHDTASQTLTGAAAAGSTVTVYDGAAKLGVVTANSSGQWSYALGQLADGAHSVTATATDQAGNTGPASGALQFTVNTQAASSTPAQPTAPAPTAPHLSDVTATWWKQAALTGEAASGSLVKVYDNGAPIGTATADSSGAWSLATRLGNGVHSFTETATDSAGSTVGSTGVALFSRSTGVQLNGGSGDDVLVGRAGDTLSGHGGHDSFVFNPSFGRETVADFSPASDTIVFDHNLFGSASAVLQHATQSGTSVLIAYDANDVVTLQNTSLSSLTQGNFAFV
ncbi:MAG TPA: Ig-like domain-containing protein, partial [Phenylobacterium sp.]|uniref:Ig-like domain-containing protein n=1 Tax=Phenylobacterium sp. TaxID=1871053 RepID=UPI002B4738AA